MTYSARDVIGTHAWIDHQEKVRSKSRHNARNWENCDTSNCCGATKKCFAVSVGATFGGTIGCLAAGIPSGGTFAIPGLICGAAIGACVVGGIYEIVEHFFEK